MKYARPSTLSELLGELEDDSARVLAGGTDLMLALRVGRRFGKLVNISRVEELRGVSCHESQLRVGALVTVAELLRSKVVREHAPLLWQAADRFASPLVRSRATVGGNLCNASPAADLALALLALDARAELASTSGSRVVPLEQLFMGPGRTSMARGEVLVAVSFSSSNGRSVSAFEKSGARPALEIALASVAALFEVDSGRVSSVRIAYGAVAPVPMRGREVERILLGQELTEALIGEAARAAASEIRPIDDVRASAAYRRRLVGAFVSRALRASEVSMPHG